MPDIGPAIDDYPDHLLCETRAAFSDEMPW
jgi:hypothetical protein